MVNVKKVNRTWIAFVVILAGVANAANLYKVPASMKLLCESFGIDAATASILVSMFSFMGMALAIPIGGILIRIGPRKMGLYAMLASVLGSILGTVGASFALLAFSRFIEGFGMAAIGVVGPAILANWYDEKDRGLPMAIWSCWVGLGMMVALKMANIVTNEAIANSWHNLWIVTSVLLVVVGALFFMSIPKDEVVGQNRKMTEARDTKKLFTNSAAWCLALAFCVYSLCTMAIFSFSTTYCQEMLHCSLIEANNYASYLTYGMIIGGVLCGVILKLSRKHHLLFIGSFIANIAVFVFVFSYTQALAIAFMLVGGCLVSMTPAAIFTLAPEAAFSPETIGSVMGIVALGQNLGGLCVTICGKIMVLYGFFALSVFLAILGAVGLFFAILYASIIKKRNRSLT